MSPGQTRASGHSCGTTSGSAGKNSGALQPARGRGKKKKVRHLTFAARPKILPGEDGGTEDELVETSSSAAYAAAAPVSKD